MNSTGTKWQLVMKDPKETEKIQTEDEKMEGVVAPPKYVKSKQPFPALPSFTAIAEILSYFDFKDYIEEILWKLSKSTREYSRNHKQLLKAFLVVKPPPQKSSIFGDSGSKYGKTAKEVYFHWPKQEDIDKMTKKEQ